MSLGTSLNISKHLPKRQNVQHPTETSRQNVESQTETSRDVKRPHASLTENRFASPIVDRHSVSGCEFKGLRPTRRPTIQKYETV